MKNKEILNALDGLVECGNGFLKMAEALKHYFSALETEPSQKESITKKEKDAFLGEATKAQAETESKQKYTKEYVRKLLANVANNGQREKVKEIIQKHGGGSLSQIDPKEYEAIVKEAEVLLNA